MTRKDSLRRLNLLLKLTGLKLQEMGDEEWEVLFDELHEAIFGSRRKRGQSDDYHYALASDRSPKSGVGQMQGKIRELVQAGSRGAGLVEFQLERHRFLIAPKATKFGTAYRCEDLKTFLSLALFDLLRVTQVTPHDILTCSAPDCGAHFVPLRKPHPGQRPFCLKKRCGDRIRQREHRKRADQKASQRERQRGRDRYAARIRKRLPNAKIQKRARKG